MPVSHTASPFGCFPKMPGALEPGLSLSKGLVFETWDATNFFASVSYSAGAE